MKKGANQGPKQVSQKTMDARAFLRTINEGVGAKLEFFSNQIREIGKKSGKNFELVSLNKNSLIYEDVDTNTYFEADIKRNKNRYAILGSRKIVVNESKKDELFTQFCQDLVEAIDKNDYARADQVFNKIEASRFRRTVIPESGIVKTRDGNVRKVSVSNKQLAEDTRKKIINTVTEAVMNNYDVTSDGNIVHAFFTDSDKLEFPVNETLRRVVLARHMRVVAESAWKKDGFQSFIKNVSGLISKRKVEEAVDLSAKFLKEWQEFCLLTQAELNTLVENALSSLGVFNSVLIEHTAALIHRTNLKVNKDAILDSWHKTAQVANDLKILTAVETLRESSDFGVGYDSFLSKVLNESVDTDMVQMALRFARNAMSKQGEAADNDTIEHIDNLISRLEKNETADRAVRDEAEEILAGVSTELMGRTEDLNDFDQIPGAEDEEELVAPEGAIEDTDEGDLGLDIGGGEEGGEDLGGGEDFDLDFGDEGEEGAGEEEMAGVGAGGEEELSLEDKKRVVAQSKKLYEGTTKNFSKLLKSRGPEYILENVDEMLSKLERVGPLAAELQAKWEELKNELSSIVGSPMGDMGGMDMGMGDTAGDMPSDEYASGMSDMGCDDAVVLDTEYTGEEEPEMGGEGAEPFAGEETPEEEAAEEEVGEVGGEDEVPDFGGEEGESEEEESEEEESEEEESAGDEDGEEDESEEMDEDQYKWGVYRQGQGARMGYGRSSINPVKESVVKGSTHSMGVSDGQFYLLDHKLNQAVCLGDGAGEFDFVMEGNGYYKAASEWMSRIVNDSVLSQYYWERSLTEGELPDFIKKKQEEKLAKKAEGDAKKDIKADEADEADELDETHDTGMHGKASGSVKWVGGDKKPAKPDVKMEGAMCPQCGSYEIMAEGDESSCMDCGVRGRTALFQKAFTEAAEKGMVDPKAAAYDSEKAADQWGDGSKRNKEPKVKNDDESGSGGAKAAPKSKEPDSGKSQGMKEMGGKGYMWGKK